jgi:hypothetical protein
MLVLPRNTEKSVALSILTLEMGEEAGADGVFAIHPKG